MFSKGRRRLTYANVTATLALVFAMTGGAYAAGKYLITSSKQISPKVLKQLVGKTGARGPIGPTAPAGTAGAAGAAGTKGEPGTAGKEGKEGKVGLQGEPGEKGEEGSPWTAGGVLPAGQTETGMWGVSALPGSPDGGLIQLSTVPISFTIPLKAPLPEANVHVVGPGEKGTGGGTCPESSSYEKPAAEPGNLCIFERGGVNVGEIGAATGENGVLGTAGIILEIKPATKSEPIDVYGNWAVTAPAA